jgi:hypothetical protein
LGPVRISCLWPTMEKKNGQYWIEKDRPHQKNTSMPKDKEVRIAF